MYESILEEICSIQQAAPEQLCYLQPYSASQIKLLAKSHPTPQEPVTLYVSLTGSLGLVSYRAKVVGWQNKRDLANDPVALELANIRIKESHQSEEIYFNAADGKQCINLISISGVERLGTPFTVHCLIKVSDGKPLKERTRAGGWSYVREQVEWLGTAPEAFGDDVEARLQAEVNRSMHDDSAHRQQRLATAAKSPEIIQVVTRGFRQNPDVIAEVLMRAHGICEECQSPAPFIRAADDTPYLEVHHRKMLSEGGEDTVANAFAICPNCHRKLHFGKAEDSVRSW